MTLIGRDRTLAVARDHLADPAVRIVTICGPAGSGTSAVLRALAASTSAWTVDLADAGRTTPTWAQVARRLGIGLDGDADAVSRIAEVVAGRPVVLAIDLARDAPVDAAGLGRLLELSPGIDVAFAAAAPLDRPDERVVRLDPLPVPPIDAGYDAIVASPSVRLFTERALEVDPRFRLDAGTAADVAQVCRLVGGLPLGIELAAARMRLLPPHALAVRLAEDGSDPDLLGSSADERAGRWPSMRAALDSTVASLTEQQRGLLACAARFAGAFPIDAIEAVDRRPLGDVLDDLAVLVDARLIEPLPVAPDEEPAFDLLPIVRTYAREAEWTGAEPAATARRDYLGTIAETAAAASVDGRSSVEGERLRVLRRDVAAALADEADPVATAALAASAAVVFEALPERAAAGAALDRVIRSGAVDGFDAELAARAWLMSAALLAESPDAPGRADEIGARWRRARALIDDAAQPLTGLLCRAVAVWIHPATGDAARFVAAVEEGRALAASIGHAAWLARFEVWSAVVLRGGGQVAEAVALALAALRRATRVGDSSAIAGATVLLRTVPAELVDGITGVPSLESALVLSRAARDVPAESMLLAALTGHELDAGRPAEAARWCRERLEDTTRRGWTSMAGLSVLHTALIAARSGDSAFAARLVAAMAADGERTVRVLPPRRREEYAAMKAGLAARLGADRFSALTAEGSMLPAAAAAAAALEWLRSRDSGLSHPVSAPHSASAAAATGAHSASALPQGAITPRELEVLALLANGLTNREIADQLLLSVKTVMHHSVAIYRKLDVRGRAEAAAYAHRHGMVA